MGRCREAVLKEEKREIHVYLARLRAVLRATSSIEKATRCLAELLAQTFFMPLALTMVAAMARFHTLLIKLLKISVDTHHQRTKMSISRVAQPFLSQDSQMPHRLLLVSASDRTVRLTVQEYSRQEIVELLPPLTLPCIPTPTPPSTLQSKAAALAFLSFVSGGTAANASAEAVRKPSSRQAAGVRSEGGISGQVCVDASVDCAQPGSVCKVGVPLTLVVQDEMQRDGETLRDSSSVPTKVGRDSLEGSDTISCGPKEGSHGDNEGAQPRKRKKEEEKSDRMNAPPRRVAWKAGGKSILGMLLGGSENEDLF